MTRKFFDWCAAHWVEIALFALSLLLRLSLISKGPYNVDTLHIALKAEQTLATGRLQYTFGVGYPGTVLLASLFLGATKSFFQNPDPVFGANLMNVVTSSLGVSLIFALVKRMLDFRTALYCAVFFSLSPLYLVLSVYGISHVPAIMFLFAGLLAISFLTEESHSTVGVAAGVFLGLMGAARLQDLVLCLPAIVLFYFIRTAPVFPLARKKACRDFGLIVFAALLTLAIFYVPLLRNVAFQQQLSRYTMLGLDNKFLGIVSSNLFVALRFLAQAMTYPGLVLAALGWVLLARKKKPLAFFLALWFSVPFLFYGNHRFMVNPRFLVIVLPPLALAFGQTCGSLTMKFPKAKYYIFALFISLVSLNFFRIYPVLLFRHEHAVLPDFCRWVGQLTAPNAVIITSDENLMIQHYSQRNTIMKPRALDTVPESALRQFQDKIDRFLSAGVPVYLTTASLLAYDEDGRFRDFLNRHYSAERVGSHYYEDWHRGGMTLQVFLFDLYRIYPAAEGAERGQKREQGILLGVGDEN